MKPLNVYSRSDEEIGRLLSNFAPTKFTLDGLELGSVEAFYVSLLFLDENKRAEIRPLSGLAAKRIGKGSNLIHTCYRGDWFELGSETHFGLIKRAIRAKLDAHPEIAEPFVSTRPRPILHECGRPESKQTRFPAAVFCRILSELREEFAERRVRSEEQVVRSE